MMKNSQLLDDMAKLATGALGGAVEATREVEKMVKSQVSKLLSGMNLVTREEFEVVRAMAAKAREEQEKQALELREMRQELERLKLQTLI